MLTHTPAVPAISVDVWNQQSSTTWNSANEEPARNLIEHPRVNLVLISFTSHTQLGAEQSVQRPVVGALVRPVLASNG